MRGGGGDIMLRKNPSTEKAPPILTTTISTGDKERDTPMTPQPQTYQSSNYQAAQTAPSYKDDSYNQQESRWNKNIQPFDKLFEKEKQDINTSQPISAPSQVPQEPKDISFVDKHSRWLRGVQILDELSDCGESA